jgi:hypothetical protein
MDLAEGNISLAVTTMKCPPPLSPGRLCHNMDYAGNHSLSPGGLQIGQRTERRLREL